MVSALLTAVIVGGTYWNLPPFAQAVEIGAWASAAWEQESAPSGHPEDFTLSRLASNLNITPEKAVAVLRDGGLEIIGAEEKVDVIAANNGLIPNELLKRLESSLSEVDRIALAAEIQKPSGLGRMTLGELSAKAGLPIELIQTRLQVAGMVADETSLFRDLASSLNLEPDGLWSIVADVPLAEDH